MKRPYYNEPPYNRPNNNYRPLLPLPLQTTFIPNYVPASLNFHTGLLGPGPMSMPVFHPVPFYQNYQISQQMQQVHGHNALLSTTTNNHANNVMYNAPPSSLLPVPSGQIPTTAAINNNANSLSHLYPQSLPYQPNSGELNANSFESLQSDLVRLLQRTQQSLLSPPQTSDQLNRSWNQLHSNGNTIVLENGDDIQMVAMDENDSDDLGSPYDPANHNVSLIDIDYNLTKGDEIDELNAIAKTMRYQENEPTNNSTDSLELWRAMGDRDYRFPNAATYPTEPFRTADESIEEKLKMHRHLSEKKVKHRRECKKKRRRSSNMSKELFDVSVSAKQLDIETVDDLPYEDLISMYNKLKEELTLLSFEENSPASPAVSIEKEIAEEKLIPLDSISSNEISDEEEVEKQSREQKQDKERQDDNAKDDTEQSMMEKEEASMLSIVLEKDVFAEQPNTVPSDALSAKVEPIPDVVVTLCQEDADVKPEVPFTLPDTATLFPSKQTVQSANGGALDENLLREQLIRTMLEKRMTSGTSDSGSGSDSPVPCHLNLPVSPKIPVEVVPPAVSPSPSTTATTKECSTAEVISSKAAEPVKPIIDLSRFHLVIHLSDSEDSMDDAADDELNALPLLGNGKQRTGRGSRSNVIHKLSTSQQEEYQKLKLEIERRELKTVSSENLQKCEAKLKESMLKRRQRNQKVGLLKHNLANSRKELKKSKAQVRQLQKMLAAAVKKVSLFSVKTQLGSKELTDSQSALKDDMQAIKRYKKLCLDMGRALHGVKYTIPTLAPEPAVAPASQPELGRKRGKSFNEALKDNLVRNLASKEVEMAIKLLRGKVRSLLKSNSRTYETVLLFEHYVSFNFALFQSSRFYLSSHSNIQFNEFSEKRSDVLNHVDLEHSKLTADYHHLTTSVLQHFNSYRFSSKQSGDISSNHWSNGLNPNQLICNYELSGVCNDANCPFQHQKDYLYGPQEKMIDVLTYMPHLDESLNLGQYRNDPKALRAELSNFVQSKLDQSKENSIESVCQEISQEIRNQSKTSVSSFLIRSIPKELVSFGDNGAPPASAQVPFGDLQYRFDLKDESFQMKLSQLCNLQQNDDPDLYLKNRFFAPEGMPLSAQLEASLSHDPHNTQMWINLAYCYLKRFREGEFDIKTCIDSSLNVLSRALELNRADAELYEQFLLFYSNKLDLIAASSNEQVPPPLPEGIVPIEQICRRILQFCSTYRLWICYLSLSEKLSHKETVVLNIMEQFCSGKIQFSSKEERSRNVLEIIMYRINLSLQLGKHEEALLFFNEVFSERIVKNQAATSSNNNTESASIANLSSLVTKEHRVFAWLCYIHLILYHSLPYHCFHLGKKSCFLHLTDTRPFVINWKNVSSENDLLHSEKVLNRAIKNCCATAEIDDAMATYNCNQSNCYNSCFALRFNLAQLSKVIQQSAQHSEAGSEMANSYAYLSAVYSDNFTALSHLHILQLFDIDLRGSDESIVLNLIESFYNSYNQNKLVASTEWDDQLVDALKHQMQFDYWLAFYNYKCGNLTKCKHILVRSLTYFYSRDTTTAYCDTLDDRLVRQLYELLLFEDFAFDADVPFEQQEEIRRGFKFGRDKRASRLVYLYLSYLMFLHIVWSQSELTPDRHYLKLDCVFSSVINSFTSRNLTNDDYKFLWLNYFLILLEFPYRESHFKSIYETLRLICVTFNSTDPIFIFHLTNAFAELIVPSDRLYFLIEIAKLNPDNVNLIIKVLNLALHLSKKETCWNFILHIVYQKKIRLQCFDFWKIAISLSIERNEHLNTHKFFQIALSLMPFNLQLWEMLKNYEVSISHGDHLVQLSSFYRNTLHMTHKLFNEK